MQALAARGLDEAANPSGGEAIAHLGAAAIDLRPAHLLAWIEIHDDHVGPLQVGSDAPHGMDLEHGRLHQTDQPIEIVDREQLALPRSFGSRDDWMLRLSALPGMLLKEALPGDAFGTAQQRQRPGNNERRHVAPDLGIVLREPFLRDARIRPVDPVGMGQLDGGPEASALAWSRRRFAHDLARRLVFAQAAERGVAQIVVRGPAAELDLGDELRLDIADLACRFAAEPLREGLDGSADALEPPVQVLGDRGRESGADAAGMEQPAVLVVAQHQGADGLARDGGRDIAGDHEFLPLRAFRFHPVLAAARAVGAVAQLRHHPFQAQPAGMPQDQIAVCSKCSLNSAGCAISGPSSRSSACFAAVSGRRVRSKPSRYIRSKA